MVNSCHAGAAGRPEDVQCVLVARSPDRLALVVEPVDELPIPSVQTLDEPARDAAQRHPVTIVPGALVGHGVHILVSTIFAAFPILSVLNEKRIAEDATGEHRFAQAWSLTPCLAMVSRLEDASVPSLLNPKMTGAVRARVAYPVVVMAARSEVEHSVDAGKACSFPRGAVFL